MRKGKSRISYNQWLEYATLKLPGQLRVYATMKKLVDTLTADDAAEARHLLTEKLLPSLGYVELSDPTEAQLGRFLAAEGAVDCIDKAQTFTIPSPLIRSILAKRDTSTYRNGEEKVVEQSEFLYARRQHAQPNHRSGLLFGL
ncbi:hypothetical protein QOT17_004761 [Balamuthia mandrillaris]